MCRCEREAYEREKAEREKQEFEERVSTKSYDLFSRERNVWLDVC
jgi:hypothetical protein